MQSGNSAGTSSCPSGAASVVALRKSMSGCWRKVDYSRKRRIIKVLLYSNEDTCYGSKRFCR